MGQDNHNLSNKDQYKDQYKEGLLSLLLCMVIWGLLPIYWKALIPIDSWIIILYRVFLGFVVSAIWARTKYSWGEIFLPLFRDKQLAVKYFGAGLLITANWSTYIWAVNAGFMIQSSIGYYIEPLVVCLLAIIIFKETLSNFKIIAFALATLAIAIQLVHYKEFPGIALGLATSFAIYAAIKKTVDQPPLISMVYETVFLAPVAFVLIMYLEFTGGGATSMMHSSYQFGLLLFAGIVTVVPLVLFGSAAKKVPMVTLGLMEYISPTMGMLLGVFVYHEPVDVVLLISLVIIWIGLGFFTVSEVRENRK